MGDDQECRRERDRASGGADACRIERTKDARLRRQERRVVKTEGHDLGAGRLHREMQIVRPDLFPLPHRRLTARVVEQMKAQDPLDDRGVLVDHRVETEGEQVVRPAFAAAGVAADEFPADVHAGEGLVVVGDEDAAGKGGGELGPVGGGEPLQPLAGADIPTAPGLPAPPGLARVPDDHGVISATGDTIVKFLFRLVASIPNQAG